MENWDVYEDKKNSHLLPDHKYPEIRWDGSTKENNPDDMSEEKIRQKFQLLTNQRNLQKREVCRNCCRTGKRGKIFGILYFYDGTEDWNGSCFGCAWYDIAEWRKRLINVLKQNVE